jgi:hypothetical protein
MSQPQVLWRPSPKQADFLAAAEDEVLYGGAAGGGKSDGLLIDALGLQQDAINTRGYQGILFRRTFTELRDLIDRSLSIYGQNCPGATYNQTEHVWTWPSGAKIEFGHMHHPNDRYKYRGRQFGYIGWDELTLFPADVEYVYLFSRLRSPETRVKCYVRATTNPDGPGQKWVKDRWAIANDGGDTSFTVTVHDEQAKKDYTRTRRFIRATLDDNPYLSETEYRIALLNLPPDEREALLRGRWDAIPVRGAYYAELLSKMRRDGRITRVPYQQGVAVDTYWDLGRSDTTAIIFMQHVALQDRVLKGYENSGEALAHYAQFINSQPYTYGTHYLPHDADYVRLAKDEASQKSWREMLEELLPNHTFDVVPRIEDVTLGIQQTRDIFGGLWMDETECAGLITALESYRKEWNDKQQVWKPTPLHDWSSNYADALRQYGQRMANRNAGLSLPKRKKRATPFRYI